MRTSPSLSRKLLLAALGLAGLLGLVGLALWAAAPYLLEAALPTLARSAGYTLEVSRVERAPGRLTLVETRVANPELTARIPRLSVVFSPWPPRILKIELDAPEATLKLAPSKTPFEPSQTLFYLLERLDVEGGRLDLTAGDLRADLSGVSLRPGATSAGASDFGGNVTLASPGQKLTAQTTGRLGWSGGGVLFQANAQGTLLLSDQPPERPWSVTARGRYLPSAGVQADGNASTEEKALAPFFGGGPIHGEWALKLPADLASGTGSVRLKPLGLPAEVRVAWPGPGETPWTARAVVDVQGQDLKALGPALVSAGLPKGVSLAGRMDAEANATADPAGWQANGSLRLRDLAVTQDLDHASEGVAAALSLSAHGGLTGAAPLQVRAKASWSQGLVLWSPWLADLGKIAGSLEATGRLEGSRLFIDQARLTGPIRAKAEGISLSQKAASVRSGQASGDIGLPYRLLLRDPFSPRFPLLGELDPQGTWALKLRNRRLDTDLRASLRRGGSPLISGLRLEVAYPLGGKGCLPGAASWEALSVPQLKLRQRRLPVDLCPDAVRVGPLALSAGEGQADIERISWNWRTGKGGVQGVDLARVHLEKLIPSLPLPAEAEGRLPKGTLEGGRLSLEGTIRVKTAGGVADIRNVWVEPLAPIPRLGADITFRGLDLAKISGALNFGKVTGVLKGRIDHLVMSGGQPEAFHLVVETDPAAASDQTISLTAVQNISILGGGGRIPLLGRLFKEFSYRKIGISCSLENDVFTLHGLMRKDGEEYLVERGLFGGVNVINRNPEGQISFRDMLDRLDRISAAGSGPEG